MNKFRKEAYLHHITAYYDSGNTREMNKVIDDIVKMTGSRFHSNTKFNHVIARLKKKGLLELFFVPTLKTKHGKAQEYDTTPEFEKFIKDVENTTIEKMLDSIQEKEPDFYIDAKKLEEDDYMEKYDPKDPGRHLRSKKRDRSILFNNLDGIIGSAKNNRWSIENNNRTLFSPERSYREFNVFNSISKIARSYTNFKEQVDVSAALQSIMIWFLDSHDIKVDAPFTRSLIADKHKTRADFAERYNMTLEEAKVAITSLYFGGDSRDYPDIKKEISKIRSLISNNIDKIDDEIFQMYVERKRDTRKLKKNGNKDDKRKIDSYTFLEYYEYQIRLILDPNREGIAVHDAVYFTKLPKDINERIKEAESKFGVYFEIS